MQEHLLLYIGDIQTRVRKHAEENTQHQKDHPDHAVGQEVRSRGFEEFRMVPGEAQVEDDLNPGN